MHENFTEPWNAFFQARESGHLRHAKSKDQETERLQPAAFGHVRYFCNLLPGGIRQKCAQRTTGYGPISASKAISPPSAELVQTNLHNASLHPAEKAA